MDNSRREPDNRRVDRDKSVDDANDSVPGAEIGAADTPATDSPGADDLSLVTGDIGEEDPAAGGRAPDSLVEDEKPPAPAGSDDDALDSQGVHVARQNRIGAGKGLDEAELGRAQPLDGKEWDGDPKKPYGTD